MSTNAQPVTDEKVKIKKKTPNKYKVILLNDDSTPIDWVIGILKEIFRHATPAAEALTMEVHNQGSAVVGTYTFEIAETKIAETINISRDNGFPLVAKIEEDK